MKVLIIDDNVSDAELVKTILKSTLNLEFVYVEDFEKMKDQFKPGIFSAVVSDYNLSRTLGTDILEYKYQSKCQPQR